MSALYLSMNPPDPVMFIFVMVSLALFAFVQFLIGDGD